MITKMMSTSSRWTVKKSSMKKKWMSMLVHYANKKERMQFFGKRLWLCSVTCLVKIDGILQGQIFIALGQRQDEEKILVILLVLVFRFGKTHRIWREGWKSWWKCTLRFRKGTGDVKFIFIIKKLLNRFWLGLSRWTESSIYLFNLVSLDEFFSLFSL